MSAHDHNGNAYEPPMPSPDMLAAAARVLGVDETAAAAGSGGREVLVSVAGPRNRTKVVRVPTAVPAGQLAGRLGAAVGVSTVAAIAVRNGPPIRPRQTLAEMGVRTGSVLVIDGPDDSAGGDPGGSPGGGGGGPMPDNQQWWSADQPAPAAGRSGVAYRVGVGVGLVAVVVGALLIGGLVFAGRAAPAGPSPLGAQAATAWATGRGFSGPRLADVPADLGRRGPAGRATVEAAGWSRAGGITSEQFIVDPATGSPYGLSVVLYNGRVAYPPTVTGLPFATAAVPQTGKIVTPSATNAASAWAAATFGANHDALAGLGFAISGPVQVLNQWIPTTGAAYVARVQVPLSNTAAGTPAAAAAAQADRSLTAANPPNPPPLAAVAQATQTEATQVQQKDKADKAILASNEKAEATAKTAAASAGSTQPATIVSVYDVAFGPAGQAVAWSPADYLIGGNA